MIVADPKPIEDIAAALTGFRRVHVLGCGSCVSVCRSGGDREAAQLPDALSRPRLFPEGIPAFTVGTIERQCERDLVKAFLTLPAGTEAVLSLACGVGVQVVSDVFDPVPVLPGLNTTFMGGADEPGVWREKCRGCGDCLLASTGGICPVARCAKSLFNGPCGGSQGGQCEIHTDAPCAWAMIYYRLKKRNMLHLMMQVRMPKDWRPGGAAGPRKRVRTAIGGGPADW